MKPEEIKIRQQLVEEAGRIGLLNEALLKYIGAESEQNALVLLRKYRRVLEKFANHIGFRDQLN